MPLEKPDIPVIGPASKYEKLFAKMQPELAEKKRQKLISDNKRNLVKSILSVYYFLRVQFDLPRRDMSMEEFELAEDALKEMAKNAVAEGCLYIPFFRGPKKRQRAAWSFYLEHGYFEMRMSPFGNWNDKHPILDTEYNINKFSLESVSNGGIDYRFAVPPNLSLLLNELFEKRYPQS